MVLWELYTRSEPYGDFADLNQIRAFVVAGGRPSLAAVDPPIGELIARCWAVCRGSAAGVAVSDAGAAQDSPETRPTFAEIVVQLQEMRWKAAERSRSAVRGTSPVCLRCVNGL
jgi:hypothetical protein